MGADFRQRQEGAQEKGCTWRQRRGFFRCREGTEHLPSEQGWTHKQACGCCVRLLVSALKQRSYKVFSFLTACTQVTAEPLGLSQSLT